jgi:hypothetical protein
MPVARHQFNGTGKSSRGWHWSSPPGATGFPPPPQPSRRPWSTFQPGASSTQPASSGHPPGPSPSVPSHRPRRDAQVQATNRWGWSSLEELGGIAYTIQRGYHCWSCFPPLLPTRVADSLLVDIGTPPQTVKVFIDTGSYELWVNPRCDTSASATLCEAQGTYYPDKSSSSMFVGGEFDVSYGTGSVEGYYWSDVLSIASESRLVVRSGPLTDTGRSFFSTLTAPSVSDSPGPICRC